MKLSLKINLLFTFIVTGILLVAGIILFNISRQNVQVDFERRLENRAARTAYLYNMLRNDTADLLRSLDANIPPLLFNKSIFIYNQFNQVIYSFRDEVGDSFRVDTRRFVEARESSPVFYSQGNKEVCVYHYPSGGDMIVAVAAENVAGKEYINNLRSIFLVFLPGAVLFTLVAGYLFSRTIIKPIKGTIHDAQLITSQNLSHRLYVGNRKDELAELNQTFNQLLDRLEDAFAIQRRFISNASHELSTPLTSVSSQIEVTLLHNRTNEEYRNVLYSVLEDVKELQHLTRNLLEIAKAGTDGAISLDKVRIDEILIRAHSEVLKQNQGYHIGLTFPELPDDEAECTVFGNPHLLLSAFKNILENGCKYSPDKTVQVQLDFRGYEIELVFSNKSDTLSSEEINRIFEPFYRGENAGGKQGFGLGLTLTRRIIGLHKGQLTVESDLENGTVFRIILPALKK
ncbi:MAG TPA: ATP-binding protein [Chitinophagaceae bacterium]|nr:ATP-binding protein [Chitinophagaceae bacterium]